jgi:hypothetical protein
MVLGLYAGWDKSRAIGIYAVQKLLHRGGRQREDSIIDGFLNVVLKWFEQNLTPNETY